MKYNIICTQCAADPDPDVSWEFYTELTGTAKSIIKLHENRYGHTVKVTR